MRKIVITQNITLDGRIEMLDDWFDPGTAAPDLEDHVRRFMPAEQAVLLGRQTFEDFRGYWPHQTDDTSGISAHLESVRKLVVSTTLGEPGWANAVVLRDATPETIRAAVDETDGETVCTGSIRLTHALLSADLVDELRLYTYPAVQGRGRRLFPDGWARPTVRLLDAESFAGGVTYRAYSFR